MSRSWKGGSTRAWRRTRALILANNRATNGGRCVAHNDGWCAQVPGEHTCTGEATQAHHTRGKRYGDDPRYLVASCQPCNLHIGDPDQAPDPQPRPMTRW